MENGLVGKWYLTHVWSEQLLQRIPLRGKIVEDLGSNCYRVEVLDIIIGEIESSFIRSIDGMVDWRLFDSQQEWERVSQKAISRWQSNHAKMYAAS